LAQRFLAAQTLMDPLQPGETGGATPWVSFCMTTRRRPDFLLKTLKSLQRQTLKDFEVIISDNDVAASGRAVVEQLSDPRFRYSCNGEDLGMNASFNRSLSRATGQYVVMITDDDPIYPDMLETLRDLSRKHPGYGAYYGGCDVFQVNPRIAKLTLHRVGTNSCLAPLPLGHVRTFTAETYPHAFFGGELDMYTLWSVGMVKREIAQQVGLPDYGSPYLGDFTYIVSACSHSGCAVVNQSFGCQTVHDYNFGREECGQMTKAALGFIDCITSRFSGRPDWAQLKPKVEKYVGQWMVLHLLFLKQYFREFQLDSGQFEAVVPELFKLPFVRRFRLYYYLASIFMRLQRLQSDLRNAALRRMRESG
jgi:glycosyltransferase involved in cell wall biosynthesis